MSMLRCFVAGAVSIGFAVLPIAAPVRAQTEMQGDASTDEEARRHFRLGQAHYENGSFSEAAVEFEEAYRLSNRPQLLYNIFVSYRDAGDMARAADALRRYLELVPDAENAAQLRARLTSMERMLATSGGSTTGTTTGSESGGSETTSTGSSESSQTSGSSESSETAGSSESAGTTESSESTPPVETPHERNPGVVPWIVMGVGGALVVAGAITGGLALSTQSSLSERCGADGGCPAGFEADRDMGRTLALATDVMLPVGLVAAATGVVLLFVLDEGSPDRAMREPPPIALGCTTTGCGLSASGTF